MSVGHQAPTVRLRRLAAELRSLRAGAGLTRDQVSEQTAINSATLYRIETAKVRPQRRTVMALLDAYGVADADRRTELTALSRETAELGWIRSFSELPLTYRTYASFEAEARSMRDYESSFVPGLLQTEDYARTLIPAMASAIDENAVERRVEFRLHRQAVLTKVNPLRLWAIVDEAVLRRLVGGTTVMRAQLRYLVDMAGRQHINFQVLPFGIGAHPGMEGSFVILSFPDAGDPDLLYVDGVAGQVFLEGEADARGANERFEQLQAMALSPADSLRFVADLADAIDLP